MPDELIPPRPSSFMLVLGAVAIIIAGSITGFLLTKAPKNLTRIKGTGTTPAMVNTATEVGSTDTKTFRDTAQGVLEAGGLNGEGTHKLIREGGPSKTAYLISSVVDLDQFVGKKVQVWGETVKGQKAGWLMDVGRLKILE